MPDGPEHQWQCDHNGRLLGEPILDPDTTAYPDWTITVAFYRAVHIVDRILAISHGAIIIHSHQQRQSLVRKHIPGVWKWYGELEEMSKKARYHARPLGVTDAKEALQLLRNIENAA